MKIYTRTGDDGSTGLIGGQRVQKSDARIECFGTVDELNAAVGLAVVAAPAPLRPMLQKIQDELFVIGSNLAAPDPGRLATSLPGLDGSAVTRLEGQIDEAEASLVPLRNFILPGGGEAAARLHMSRAICRRAERLLVDFSREQPLLPTLLTYINRLSDWLFVQARWVNHHERIADIIWTSS